MGVGKTVYKGEVKTGVFAWFWAWQAICRLFKNCTIPMGAGLPAMRECQSPFMSS